MAPNKTRNAGRQLLLTRNRLKTELSGSKRASLMRMETSLLLELGQREAAVAVATSLAGGNSAGSSQRAFLADTLARAFFWRKAEDEFAEAHRLCVAAGKTGKAFSLAAGPMFLLAEARGDYRRCVEVAPLEVLKNRARRLLGEKPSPAAIPFEAPWSGVAVLENAYSAGDPAALIDVLTGWSCGEAEWRWRIVFEGAILAAESGLSVKPWRKFLMGTGTKVLDPRYFGERKQLKRIISGGFGCR